MGGLQADVELHGSGDGVFYRSFTLRPGVVALSPQVAPAMKPGIKDAQMPPAWRGPKNGSSARSRPIRDTQPSSHLPGLHEYGLSSTSHCDSGLAIFGRSTAVECWSLNLQSFLCFASVTIGLPAEPLKQRQNVLIAAGYLYLPSGSILLLRNL